MPETSPIALLSHERFIDRLDTTDHNSHALLYFRLRALYALRKGCYGTYEYWRVRAGDHLRDGFEATAPRHRDSA